MRGLNFFRVLFNLSTTLPAKPRESFSNNLLSNSKIRTLNFNSSNLTSRLNLLSSLFLRFEAIYPPFSVNQSRVFSQTYKILPQLFLKRLGALFLATEFMRRTTATF